eukprot:1144497-Pelagomonas_calceolata.AAC.7
MQHFKATDVVFPCSTSRRQSLGAASLSLTFKNPDNFPTVHLFFFIALMNDDKTARDYNIEGGSVLHLVSHAIAPVIVCTTSCSHRLAWVVKNFQMCWLYAVVCNKLDFAALFSARACSGWLFLCILSSAHNWNWNSGTLGSLYPCACP